MAENTQDAVILLDVGDIQHKGRKVYYYAKFKKGPFGRVVIRHIFGDKQNDGSIRWSTISFEDALRLKGQDVSAHVDIVGANIEPEQIEVAGEVLKDRSGEPYLMTQRSFVVFSDENLEQAILRSGFKPDSKTIHVIVHHYVKVVAAQVELPQE